VLAEVRLDGTTVARFDLAPYEPKDFAVARAGEMQLILHGDVVATVSTPAGSCGPSVEVSAYCSDDASHRYYWVVDTERFYAVSAELRQAGHRVGTMLLQPFDYILVVSRDASDLQAVVDGVVVGESPASNQPCEVIPEDAIVLAAEETGGATLPVTGGGGDGLIPIGLLLLASGVTLLVATRRWAVR